MVRVRGNRHWFACYDELISNGHEVVKRERSAELAITMSEEKKILHCSTAVNRIRLFFLFFSAFNSPCSMQKHDANEHLCTRPMNDGKRF